LGCTWSHTSNCYFFFDFLGAFFKFFFVTSVLDSAKVKILRVERGESVATFERFCLKSDEKNTFRVDFTRFVRNVRFNFTETFGEVSKEIDFERICETVLSRSELLATYIGNLQSYWTTTKLWKLTVVDYYEAMETYSRIELLRSYGNLQSYWTTAKLWKLTVVLDYYEAMETYRRIIVTINHEIDFFRQIVSVFLTLC
jgi:hypothetical protein